MLGSAYSNYLVELEKSGQHETQHAMAIKLHGYMATLYFATFSAGYLRAVREGVFPFTEEETNAGKKLAHADLPVMATLPGVDLNGTYTHARPLYRIMIVFLCIRTCRLQFAAKGPSRHISQQLVEHSTIDSQESRQTHIRYAFATSHRRALTLAYCPVDVIEIILGYSTCGFGVCEK